MSNAHVQTQLERLRSEYEEGMDEGYSANPNQLPAWWHTKTLVQLSARERGYFCGREVRLAEEEA